MINRLAVLARGEKAMHSALLLRGWTDDLVLLTDGPADLGDEDRARLAAAGVKIDERSVAELVGARTGNWKPCASPTASRLECRGLLAATTLHQRSRWPNSSAPSLARRRRSREMPVKVDELCRTTAPGVFAAGDLSAQPPQVASAIAAGSLAAVAVVQSLLADDCGLPVPEWREDVDA